MNSSINDDEDVVYFGETDARNRRLRFGIKKKDRSRHLYAIGKTGMGKSTLLENLAIQDIQNGDGMCFIDPHGKSADFLLDFIPQHRIKDVIYFAPFDMDYPVSFNVMEDVGPERRYLVASGLMAAFKKIWVDAWSARMEYILGNIMLALLEYPGSTLVGVNRMLTDKDFRKEVVNNITDPSVKSFWVNEYASYTDKFAAEAAPAIQNKVGQFIANPLIRNIIGQEKSSFDIRDVMDNKKILIINLSKGRVGEANANLLGSMLITKIYLGAMSRADLTQDELAKAPNFYLYVDEFQSFANESFADILSEARKYKLNLHIAHQYIEQMTDEVRAAVFGNVGTMCIFRVGAYDAEVLEKEFAPYFTAEDIVNLQKHQMYLKLMIDGVTSQPFSAGGMPPIPRQEVSYLNEIIASSRAQYARPRQQVEDELLAWIQKQFGRSAPVANAANGANSSSSGSTGSVGSSSQAGGGQRSNSTSTGSQQSNGAPRSQSPSGGQNSSSQGQSQGPRTPENRPNTSNSQSSAVSQQTAPDTRPKASDQRSNGVGTVAQSPRTSQGTGPMRSSGEGQSDSQSGVQSAGQSSGQNSNINRQDRPVGDRLNDRAGERPNDRTGDRRDTRNVSRSNTHSSTNGPGPRNDRNGGTGSNRSGDRVQDTEIKTERENEFRKAISLGYLKAEEPKNDQKTPKAENINALRDALLSVMGGVGLSTENTETKTEETGESKSERVEEKEIPQQKIEQKEEDKTQASVKIETQTTSQHEFKKDFVNEHIGVPRYDKNPNEGKNNNETQVNKSGEISEEELKKILG